MIILKIIFGMPMVVFALTMLKYSTGSWTDLTAFLIVAGMGVRIMTLPNNLINNYLNNVEENNGLTRSNDKSRSDSKKHENKPIKT